MNGKATQQYPKNKPTFETASKITWGSLIKGVFIYRPYCGRNYHVVNQLLFNICETSCVCCVIFYLGAVDYGGLYGECDYGVCVRVRSMV